METEEQKELNPNQKLFCKLYATEKEFFGNGTQAYIEAYNIDTSKKNAYNSARVSASKLLTKSNILEEIRNLLELGGLNDERVDKELLFLIQQNAEFPTKLGAIREYNNLKSRIQSKLDVTSGGKPISGVTVKFVEDNEDDTETEGQGTTDKSNEGSQEN